MLIKRKWCNVPHIITNFMFSLSRFFFKLLDLIITTQCLHLTRAECVCVKLLCRDMETHNKYLHIQTVQSAVHGTLLNNTTSNNKQTNEQTSENCYYSFSKFSFSLRLFGVSSVKCDSLRNGRSIQFEWPLTTATIGYTSQSMSDSFEIQIQIKTKSKSFVKWSTDHGAATVCSFILVTNENKRIIPHFSRLSSPSLIWWHRMIDQIRIKRAFVVECLLTHTAARTHTRAREHHLIRWWIQSTAVVW